MMTSCTFCRSLACIRGEPEHAPETCCMKKYPEIYERSKGEYRKGEAQTWQIAGCYTESHGYKKWNRVRELIEFCKFMSFRKIGIAHCIGLVYEASLVAEILEGEDLEVVQVLCKTGAVNKESLGIPSEYRLRPEAPFEAACNPVAQAEICNMEKTDLNVIVGLCIGHDIAFTKYSQAPVTTLIVKDRTNGHNPAAALYSSYQRSDLLKDDRVYPRTKRKVEK